MPCTIHCGPILLLHIYHLRNATVEYLQFERARRDPNMHVAHVQKIASLLNGLRNHSLSATHLTEVNSTNILSIGVVPPPPGWTVLEAPIRDPPVRLQVPRLKASRLESAGCMPTCRAGNQYHTFWGFNPKLVISTRHTIKREALALAPRLCVPRLKHQQPLVPSDN
jgi:hypothetical protein